MTHVSWAGREVTVDGTTFTTDYPVREAFELGGRLIVLIDPEAYLGDPGYPRERRRGRDALRNLRAYTPRGALLWEAGFPEAADYYYRIESRAPLTALSFSSFSCVIDPASGQILEKRFLK